MLELRNIAKTYNNVPLLKDISLRVKSGETIGLLGPSGSGKSTLLRIIAGLELPDAGTIHWNQSDLAPLPPHLRDFGLVFQDYALFPHLTVSENIAFGLNMRNISKIESQRRVDEVLSLVNLRSLADRGVSDLSGGEAQRVALARALAPRPRLLMFDEPLGALDRSLKADLLIELRSILRETKVPAIYVTHDQEEAFAIADRVLLLHNGNIVREGTPAQVWSNPGSAWAARFLGAGNVIEGTVLKVEGTKLRVATGFGVIAVKCKHQHVKDEQVSLLFRPLPFPRGGGAGGEGKTRIKARVEESLFDREQFQVRLRGGLIIHMKNKPRVGSQITIGFSVKCLDHE